MSSHKTPIKSEPRVVLSMESIRTNNTIRKVQETPEVQPAAKVPKKRRRRLYTFPTRLHALLDDVDGNGFGQHLISWQPHGRCFTVQDTAEFEKVVMPVLFKQTKWSSFQRQLNLYGFQRLYKGRDKGGYWHEHFLRGKPEFCDKVLRTKVKGTGVRCPTNLESEPDFYDMQPMPALSQAVRIQSETDAKRAMTIGHHTNYAREYAPARLSSSPLLLARDESGSSRGMLRSPDHHDFDGLLLNSLIESEWSKREWSEDSYSASSNSSVAQDDINLPTDASRNKNKEMGLYHKWPAPPPSNAIRGPQPSPTDRRMDSSFLVGPTPSQDNSSQPQQFRSARASIMDGPTQRESEMQQQRVHSSERYVSVGMSGMDHGPQIQLEGQSQNQRWFFSPTRRTMSASLVDTSSYGRVHRSVSSPTRRTMSESRMWALPVDDASQEEPLPHGLPERRGLTRMDTWPQPNNDAWGDLFDTTHPRKFP